MVPENGKAGQEPGLGEQAALVGGSAGRRGGEEGARRRVGGGDAVGAGGVMRSEGEAGDAAATFVAVLGEGPELAEAHGGLIRARIALGGLDAAGAALAAVPAKLTDAAPIDAARAQLDLAKQAQSVGPLDDLKAKVEANADDHQARFEYAQALYAAGDAAGAVEQLPDLFRPGREGVDGAA